MTELLAGAKAIRAVSAADHSEGMSYLESLPRRLVTLYLPLGVIMLVLCSRSTGWR
jgi:multiple sugar transport system permease protein